jgi:hypothetical protein
LPINLPVDVDVVDHNKATGGGHTGLWSLVKDDGDALDLHTRSDRWGCLFGGEAG